MRCCSSWRWLAVGVVLAIGLGRAGAEPMIIPSEIAVQISKHLLMTVERDANAPIKLEGDAEKATGLYEQSAGGLIILPVKGVKDGTELKGVDGANGAGAGYLFLHKLTVVADGKPVAQDKIPKATFMDPEGNERDALALRLAIKKEADDKWQLLVFGKDKKPIATAKFRPDNTGSDMPFSVSVKEVEGDQGTLVVNFVGKFSADLRLAKLP